MVRDNQRSGYTNIDRTKRWWTRVSVKIIKKRSLLKTRSNLCVYVCTCVCLTTCVSKNLPRDRNNDPVIYSYK